MTNVQPKPQIAQRTVQPKVQKLDYNNTSHCRNTGKYAHFGKCISCKTDCRYYETIKKNDGTIVGICRPRYDVKKKAREAEREADIQNTQNLSTYNGRRNE